MIGNEKKRENCNKFYLYMNRTMTCGIADFPRFVYVLNCENKQCVRHLDLDLLTIALQSRF